MVPRLPATSLGVHLNEDDKAGTANDFEPAPVYCRISKGKVESLLIGSEKTGHHKPHLHSSLIPDALCQSVHGLREQTFFPWNTNSTIWCTAIFRITEGQTHNVTIP